MLDLTTEQIDALEAGNVVHVHLVEMLLTSGTLRFNSSLVDLDWNSSTWLGRGNVGSIGVFENKDSGEATGQQYVLSGVPPSFIALAFQENVQGKEVIQYFAICDPETNQITTAFEVYRGLLDRPVIKDSIDSAEIVFPSESRAIIRRRPKISTYSNADQRKLNPLDGSMRFAVAASTEPFVWPARTWFQKQ
jgi:hypothetical protein